MKKIIIPVVVIIFGAVGALAYKSLKIEKIPSLLDRRVADSDVNEWKHIKMSVDELHSKIRKNLNDNTSRLRLAEIYIEEGNISRVHFYYYYSAALNLLNYVIDNSAEESAIVAQAKLNKASLLLSLNQFGQVLKICNELSESPKVNEIKFDAFVGIGDYANAKRIADHMQSSGLDLKLCVRLASLYEIKGNITEAKDILKRGLDSDSTNKDLIWEARYKLGMLFEKEEDLVKAEEIFKDILAENPEHVFAKSGIARIKSANRDYESAVEMLEAIYNSNSLMLFKQDIARIYKNAGRMNDARKEVQDIINIIEEGEKVGCNYDLVRASLYSEILEDFDLAFIYAERAKNIYPENVDINKVLSLIYYKLGKYGDASYYLNKANSIQANDPSLMCLSGLLKCKTGNSQEGIVIIKRAMAQMHYHCGALTGEAQYLLSKEDLSVSIK